MKKSAKDETSSQASAKQSKLTVNLGLIFDSPEGKIGSLIKRFKEQSSTGDALKSEISKVDLSKHRLAKLGGALIKEAKEGDMSNVREILDMVEAVTREQRLRVKPVETDKLTSCNDVSDPRLTFIFHYVLAAFQLLANSKDNDAFALMKATLALVETICESQRGKEEAGKVFLLPLIKELQEDRSSSVRTLIAECINCLLQGAPDNVQLFVRKRAPTRDLKAIVSLIVTSPDYHMQGVLIEVLYRITRRDKAKWAPLFEDKEIDEAFWKIAGRKFRDDVRSFLNIFNDKLGAARQIFSFKFRKLFLNEVESVGSEDEWIDFGPTNICFWIASDSGSTQCYIHFDTLVKTEFSGSYLVFEVSESPDLPEEVVDPNTKKPQLVSMLFDDKDIEAIRRVIEPLAQQLKYKRPSKSEGKSPEKQKVSKAVLIQKPAEPQPKKVLKIPRLQVSTVGPRDNNNKNVAEVVIEPKKSTKRAADDISEEDQRSTQPQDSQHEQAAQTTQIGNMTFAIQKNRAAETQNNVLNQSLFGESTRNSRPPSPLVIRSSRPPSPIDAVALGTHPRIGRMFSPLPSPSSPLSKSLRTIASLPSDASGPTWNVLKSSRAPSLSEFDEISPEKPQYLDREQLQPRRLFESPQAKISSPPRHEELDEIISEEISVEEDVDFLPIDTHTSPKESSPKDLMRDILERIQALEKISTNQKMRKDIELTLKQLRVLESQFAEYNRDHILSILNDFTAGINRKLDQFLKDKQREVENDPAHGTKRKLAELTGNLQEQCKKMKVLHRQVSNSIQEAEDIVKQCDMQRVIVENQENRASRDLKSDIDSFKEEIQSDLAEFKNSWQPLFKGTDLLRITK